MNSRMYACIPSGVYSRIKASYTYDLLTIEGISLPELNLSNAPERKLAVGNFDNQCFGLFGYTPQPPSGPQGPEIHRVRGWRSLLGFFFCVLLAPLFRLKNRSLFGRGSGAILPPKSFPNRPKIVEKVVPEALLFSIFILPGVFFCLWSPRLLGSSKMSVVHMCF